MVADTLAVVERARTSTISVNTDADGSATLSTTLPKPLVRNDSAYFGYPTIGTAIRSGAEVSITTGLNSVIRSSISTIARSEQDRRRSPRHRQALTPLSRGWVENKATPSTRNSPRCSEHTAR